MIPRLPMTLACSHYRYDGNAHGCAVRGECKPIQQGPDLSACGDFHHPQHVKPMPKKKGCCGDKKPTTESRIWKWLLKGLGGLLDMIDAQDATDDEVRHELQRLSERLSTIAKRTTTGN